MAIIDAIPGLKVEVIADGARLQEYPDPEAPAATSSKQAINYIEARPKGTFKIWTQFLQNFPEKYSFHVEIRLDGQEVSSQIVPLKDLKTPAGHTPLEIRSHVNGAWQESNMVFSPSALGKF
jgi:hypothetical protein